MAGLRAGDAAQSSILPLWIQREEVKKYGMPGIVALLSLAMAISPGTTMVWFVSPLVRFLLTIVGTAMGIGLGLGLATHVHEHLERMSSRTTEKSPRTPTGGARKMAPMTKKTMGWDNDETAYSSFMDSAGYDVTDHLLRGQVVRPTAKFFRKAYPFTDTTTPENYRAVRLMQEQWPTLPARVSFEVGKFMEHVVRDYVSSWYSYIDSGCEYQNEREKRKEQEERRKYMEENNIKEEPPMFDPRQRTMVFSTALHRPIPMLNEIYNALGTIFGNLCTRVEGVNVLSLLLIKWVKVISQTFRVYRRLRKEALAKTQPALKRQRSMRKTPPTPPPVTKTPSSSSTGKEDSALQSTSHDEGLSTDSSTPELPRPAKLAPVSEMAVTKQFLVKGKLHRAVTFGMDVPSLLFADSEGKDCGIGKERKEGEELNMTEEEVLEARLFDTRILKECELDYNRVLGYRLIRALLPRTEFSSLIVRTMLAEMMGGCVLNPMMSCFCPEYVNGWILLACAQDEESKEQEEETEKSEEPAEDGGNSVPVAEEGDEGLEVALGMSKNIGRQEDLEVEKQQDDVVASAPPPPRLDEVVREEFTSDLEKENSQGDFFSSTRDAVNIDEEEDEPNAVDDTIDTIEEVDVLGDSKNELANEVPEDNEPDEPLPTGDFILPLLTMSLIELQRFMDFEECRDAQNNQDLLDINWDDPGCQDAVTQLVLVIESALVHGRRREKLADQKVGQAQDQGIESAVVNSSADVEVAISPRDRSTLVSVLLEMTSDIDSFEDRILEEEEAIESSNQREMCAQNKAAMKKPTASELKTLRSLIAAWLHTGQAHRIVSVLMNAENSVLKPFYFKHSFIRTRDNVGGFVRQLRSLNGVTILVDTMSVLSAASMDINEDGDVVIPKPEPKQAQRVAVEATKPKEEKLDSSKHGSKRGGLRGLIGGGGAQGNVSEDAEAKDSLKTVSLPSAYSQASGTPRFLDFRRNENFAASLRSERDRRMESWKSATADKAGLRIVVRMKGSSENEVAVHREMHQIARIFYAGTNMVAIRNGARRKEGGDQKSGEEQVIPLSLLTVEMTSARRRIEVPDDDSSFLLRAQPRALSALGVHRDPVNHDNSFKGFAATYEEPAIRPGSNRYSGGRYLRRCVLRYFPNDRTASITLAKDSRELDQRKDKGSSGSVAPGALAGNFLGRRNLCQKWIPRGATPRSGSLLSSSVMEHSDFNAVPRSGKAIDFVYKCSLFEKPMVDLAGKRFTVHDSSISGTHRADASALEMSDATLSLALMQVGDDWHIPEGADPPPLQEDAEMPRQPLLRRSSVEMGSDGYPIIWMKYARKQGDKNVTEVRSYRTSFIRAALMVTAARLDAQQQCLLKCVRAGSARSATKQRTEAYLQPTAKLLEYANSAQREKQSILLRDLKLGINHIDRQQLRRNGLLSPRYPTVIRALSAHVEEAANAKDVGLGMPGMAATTTFYKIRCEALVSICEEDVNEGELEPFRMEDERLPAVMREEWLIYRSYKDFQTLHKHLKTQVAQTEQSASAGARLVGAATAAFTVGGSGGSNRRRKALIPSLGQASKASTLGVATKKFIQKRMAILNGYLSYMLAPNHLLNRNAEMLIFLGAFYPFPAEAKIGGDFVNNKLDLLGRSMMIRTVYEHTASEESKSEPTAADKGENAALQLTPSRPRSETTDTTQTEATIDSTAQTASNRSNPNLSSPSTTRSVVGMDRATEEEAADDTTQVSGKTRLKEIDMIPAIKAKIDEVPLSQVRSALFELVRYQFDFDNASFFRNRMFSALKTMSFAVASSGEFRKMLYESHTKYISADAIADWIKFGLDLLWPDGMWMQGAPPLTAEERAALALNLKQELPKAFPDQLKSVLGQEIVMGGLDILHEMLQNRLVLKSMIYMMFDMLWLEAFPELHDFLQGAAALESE